MHRWRQQNCKNNLSKCENVAMGCAFARKQRNTCFPAQRLVLTILGEWRIKLWQFDYRYKKNWRSLKILVCFSFNSHVWAWNVIMKKEFLAFFLGSFRHHWSHRLSSLSHFDLQLRKFLLIPHDRKKCFSMIADYPLFKTRKNFCAQSLELTFILTKTRVAQNLRIW